MPTIAIGDGSLHVETDGRGPPLLLISGLGGLASFWSAQVDAFARDFTVVRYDHRGCGRSASGRVDHSIDQMLEDALGIMDALKLENASILGHSTGGTIAQRLATRHPARVSRLVLSASWAQADAHFERLLSLRLAVLQGLGVEAHLRLSTLLLHPPWYVRDHHDALAARETAAARTAEPATIAARMRAIAAFDGAEELDLIAAPTLVVVAADDVLTPPHHAELLASRIRRARLSILPRGGHYAPVTAAAEFRAAVLPFLTARDA